MNSASPKYSILGYKHFITQVMIYNLSSSHCPLNCKCPKADGDYFATKLICVCFQQSRKLVYFPWRYMKSILETQNSCSFTKLQYNHKQYWQHQTGRARVIWSKKIRPRSKIRLWCDQGSFFSKITDHDLIWYRFLWWSDRKTRSLSRSLFFNCHYLKSQFGNNF